MGNIVKGLALSVAASSVVMAGGYKIPEQSLNSMALGAAYVAHTTGADTAYFNPANMSFMDAEKSYVEGGKHWHDFLQMSIRLTIFFQVNQKQKIF